jgi:HNH endonuclease
VTGLCQLCRRPTNTGFCADTIECYFRARRRLGMSVARCLEAKARDLERLANEARARGEQVANLPPPSRNAEYHTYLASPRWRAFREDALRTARWTCECGDRGPDVEVHHLTYERLGCERPDDVIVLCPACHREKHDLTRENAA